jgi:hypothetical protein
MAATAVPPGTRCQHCSSVIAIRGEAIARIVAQGVREAGEYDDAMLDPPTVLQIFNVAGPTF